MSIQYLLDGYNIIHQMPVLNLTKLEEQRQHLVHFIERYAPQGSLNNAVTIVFDGDTDAFGGIQSSCAKIIFSQGESADEKIKKIVTDAKNAKSIVVVSDDRDIQYAVRALGAKTSSVKAFLSKADLPGKKRSKNNKQAPQGLATSEKYISKTDEAKITSELERIWLKPDQE